MRTTEKEEEKRNTPIQALQAHLKRNSTRNSRKNVPRLRLHSDFCQHLIQFKGIYHESIEE